MTYSDMLYEGRADAANITPRVRAASSWQANYDLQLELKRIREHARASHWTRAHEAKVLVAAVAASRDPDDHDCALCECQQGRPHNW